MGTKKQGNRMYALWCHPEAVQWWFDQLVAGHNGSWSSKMQSAISIILNDPIRIRATKDSLGLFPNQMWRIRSAPECVREWHRDMYSAKFFECDGKTRVFRHPFFKVCSRYCCGAHL